MNERPLTTPDAVQLLRTLGVLGTDAELARVARACALMDPILRHAAEALIPVEKRASRFFEDDVQRQMIERLKENQSHITDTYYMGSLSGSGSISTYMMHGLYRGDYWRGQQLLNLFKTAPKSPEEYLLVSTDYPTQEHDRALYAMELGDLNTAESIFRALGFESLPMYYIEYAGPSVYRFIARQNLVDLLTLRGELFEAEHIIDYIVRAYSTTDVIDSHGDRLKRKMSRYLEVAVAARGEVTGSNPYARRAHIYALHGEVEHALHDFKAAEQFQQDLVRHYNQKQKYYFDAIVYFRDDEESMKQAFQQMVEAEKREPILPALTGHVALLYGTLLTRLGKLRSALKVIDYNRRWAQHYLFRPMTARAHVYQSDIHRLMREYNEATRMLELPLTWAAESGHKEILTLALIAKARLHLAHGQFYQARDTAERAQKLAENHGFLLLQIDALLTQGHSAFQRGKLDEAHSLAHSALNLAYPIECGYTWGHAAALHLMGMTHHIRRDEMVDKYQSHSDLAYRLLQGAAEIRQRIQDPRLPNTLELLADLPAPTEEY
jgi:tetratricopeptide (TPR) repeat protein